MCRKRSVTYRVYVGNIFHVEKEDLRDAFSKFGPLRDVWVARNPRGFGFVTFEESADADKAIDEANGMDIRGEKVTVELARNNVCHVVPFPFICRENVAAAAIALALAPEEDAATPEAMIVVVAAILAPTPETEEAVAITLAPTLALAPEVVTILAATVLALPRTITLLLAVSSLVSSPVRTLVRNPARNPASTPTPTTVIVTVPTLM